VIIALSAGRDAPSELRARLALDEEGQRLLLRAPRPGVGELAILCTCHRTEVYATADGAEADAVHVVAGLLPGLRPTDQHDLRFMDGAEAIEHLFRVACGLDSLVVGEPQVLVQVRRAYVLAQQEGAAGPVLSNVFGRAIHLGKRARTDTPLGRLGQSIGTIATSYLASRFGTLEGRRGAVVGAGIAATDAAMSLRSAGAKVRVVSRSSAAAERLARRADATVHPLDQLSGVLLDSEFAVVAVSGGMLVRPPQLPRRNGGDPFIVLDLSVPRAVDVDEVEGVELRSLEEIPVPRGPEVTSAVIDAEALVRKEVAELERWLDTRASGPLIRDLRARADVMVRDEVARTISGMDLSPDDQERIAGLAVRITNKLLHGPTAALRDADEETRELISRLFGLET
jgi:glutamyl-tRNA reductase